MAFAIVEIEREVAGVGLGDATPDGLVLEAGLGFEVEDDGAEGVGGGEVAGAAEDVVIEPVAELLGADVESGGAGELDVGLGGVGQEGVEIFQEREVASEPGLGGRRLAGVTMRIVDRIHD